MHKKNIGILDFFYKYWVTIVLIIALLTLFRQNFIINQFPASLLKKQQIIDENIQINQALAQKNKNLTSQFKTDTNQEILESQARYRFGLVKPSEIYYQINP